MHRNRLFIAGFVVLVLAGLLDVVSLFGDNGPEPKAIVIGSGALGIITLAAAVPTWRGSTTGVVTMVVTRVLSALSAIPALGADLPGSEKVVASSFVVITGLAVFALTAPMRSERARRTVRV